MLAKKKPIYPRCWLCAGVGGLLTNNPFPPKIQVCSSWKERYRGREEGIEDCNNLKQGKADGKSVVLVVPLLLSPSAERVPQSDADCGRSNCNKGNVIGWLPAMANHAIASLVLSLKNEALRLAAWKNFHVSTSCISDETRPALSFPCSSGQVVIGHATQRGDFRHCIPLFACYQSRFVNLMGRYRGPAALNPLPLDSVSTVT